MGLNSPTPINKSFSSHDISTSPTNNRLVSQPTTTVQRQAHKPLKIININFQSIKNKIAELGNFISVSDPDILIGTETWLNQTITDNEIFPPGYSLLRKDRQDGYGGVLLAIKSDIIHEPIATPIQLEMTATKIHLNNNKHIIRPLFFNLLVYGFLGGKNGSVGRKKIKIKFVQKEALLCQVVEKMEHGNSIKK